MAERLLNITQGDPPMDGMQREAVPQRVGRHPVDADLIGTGHRTMTWEGL